MAQYRALTGIDYPPGKRVEAGKVVSDLPDTSVKWLLHAGLIEPVTEAKPAAKKSTPAKGE